MRTTLSKHRNTRGAAPLWFLVYVLLCLLAAGVMFYMGWRIVELVKAIQEGRIKRIEEIERGTPNQATPDPSNRVARVSFSIPTPS